MEIFVALTPFIPLSLRERGIELKRGASASLRRPVKLVSFEGGRRFKRGGRSPPLKTTSPFPSRGRGIKGDRVQKMSKEIDWGHRLCYI